MATEFGYLLNAMERAACESNPAKHNYHEKRIAVLGHVSALAAEVDSLRAELAECRKDADRYKWLRFPRLHWDVLHQRDEDSVWLDMHGNDLDIAIDAAILLDKR